MNAVSATETTQRIDRLNRRVVGPLQWVILIPTIGLPVEALAGGVVLLTTPDPLAPALVAFGVGAVFAFMALAPLLDPIRRGAFATTFDHVMREQQQWKVDTGTGIPRTRRAMRTWLERHPDAPERGALFLILGRLDEADAAIEALPTRTDVDRFERELLRQTAVLYRGGQAVDLSELKRLRAVIRDPTAQRDRAQCIAALEAYVAADAGGDPLPPLAAAWVAEGRGAWARRPAILILQLLASTLVLAPLILVLVSITIQMLGNM